MVSRGVQKNDRWNSWFLTGYRFWSVTAACRYRAPWTDQATGWSAGRQSRREFAVQRSVQHIEWAFCFCHVHSPFRFFVCFYCSTVLLMRKAHVSHVLHCNSAYILFCPKIKKKCRKLAFSALWKHEYMISACWTSRALCWPCQTSGDFFAFHLIFGLILRFFYTSDSNFHPRA